MPYIKLEERPKFKDFVEEAVAIITQGNETPYIQGEFFGYYVNRLARKFLVDPDAERESFNSLHFNESKKKTLANCADKIFLRLNPADPLGSAGDFNYCITAVLWGISGQAKDVPDARYGVRSYLGAIVERVKNSLQVPNMGTQRDTAMAFRRHLVIMGVLRDVLVETDRRPTAAYEDEKRFDNKDIWVLGKLVISLEDALVYPPNENEVVTKGAE